MAGNVVCSEPGIVTGTVTMVQSQFWKLSIDNLVTKKYHFPGIFSTTFGDLNGLRTCIATITKNGLARTMLTRQVSPSSTSKKIDDMSYYP